MDNARKEEARQEAIADDTRQAVMVGAVDVTQRVNEMQARYESRIEQQKKIIDTQKERILALEEEVRRLKSAKVSRTRRW